MNVVPFVRPSQTEPSPLAAMVIRELLDHAEALADEQDFAELSFLIGLAAVAADDIVEGTHAGATA